MMLSFFSFLMFMPCSNVRAYSCLILSFISRVWGSGGDESDGGGKAVAVGKAAVEDKVPEAQTTAAEAFVFFVASSA